MTDDANQYQFVKVASVDELPPGERLFFEIGSQPVALLHIGSEFFAIADVCTHDEGPLGDGELDGCQIICPRHGARFDLHTGKALTYPARLDTPVYPVRIVDGQIEVGVPRESSSGSA